MRFDLEDLNPGVFFPFNENDEDEGGVTIRLANSEMLENATKQCVKKRIEFRKGQRFEVIDEDELKRSKLLWEYVIVSWQNVVNKDDEEILCTNESKVMLMRKSVVFAKFISDCLDKLTDDTESYMDDLEKNS